MKNKNIVCYYHNDPDGILSAAIVKRMLFNLFNINFIPCKYGETPELYKNQDKCFIVDYSFTKDIMNEFHSTYGDNLIWIDHHETAIDNLDDKNIRGMRNKHYSAARLTWMFFYSNFRIPNIVHYIEDYDLYSFRYDVTRYIHESFNATISNPENIKLQDMLNDKSTVMNSYINMGYVLYSDKLKRVERRINNGFSKQLFGYNTLIVNGEDINEIGEKGYTDYAYDIVLIWKWDKDDTVKCSLRSRNEVDVRSIAEKYNGGGHKNAAGFRIDSLKEFCEEFIYND